MLKEHHTAEIINAESEFPVLLLCEHADNKLPPHEPDYLGMDKEFLDSYHGYDLGIPDVARKCARDLNATLVAGVYSRLYIDLNRHLEAPDLLHDHDDGIIIPANQNLTDEQLQKRLDDYYHPYHEICEYHIKRLMDMYDAPALFSFHSFPRHQTSYEDSFPWNFTVHYNKDERMAEIFKEHLAANYPDIFVGDNEPYDLKTLQTGGIRIHGESRDLANLLIEVPNDQMVDADGINYWSGIITEILQTVPEKLGIEKKKMAAIG